MDHDTREVGVHQIYQPTVFFASNVIYKYKVMVHRKSMVAV